MTLYKWSQAAAANGTADGSCPFPENMAPSAMNDGARGVMAAIAKYRDDTSGLIVTAGSSTGYTVSSFQQFDTLAHLGGQVVVFTPHVTNGPGPVTLNVDALGAKPLRTAPGADLQGGIIVQGTPYAAIYNATDGAFYLQGFFGNPYNVPIGAGMDYWSTTAPNSSFVFPIGQAISRTTYATLFALLGTTFGAGDGSTTFNLPDVRGRVTVMKETAATLLTSTYFGGDSTQLGTKSGAESRTLVTANLPPYTPSGSVATSISHNAAQQIGNVDPGGGTSVTIPTANHAAAISATSTFTGNAQGGTSVPIAIVQPTIVCNYIIRVI
ncbi:phage tail protein [Bradyrhizobium sp. HKCCYLS2038]|uniref:phage tail protein n=1 Tax=unclassified Bradyrhizobium TaxID=2631580 RepID=UPI003EBB7EBB